MMLDPVPTNPNNPPETDEMVRMVQRQHAERVKAIKRGYRSDLTVMLLLLVALLGFSVLGPWIVANWLPARSLPNVVQVENLTVVGEAALCPGDVLTYRYELVADSAGVIEIDTSAVRVDAAYFMVPSTPSRIVIDGPIRVPMTERWVVSEFARDPRTGEFLLWQPGRYLRTLSISTPGQSSTPAIAAVPFSIRADCPGRPF